MLSLLACSRRRNSAVLLANFPFASNLLDTVSGATAAFSRSTAKTAFTNDRLALQNYGIDVPAFRDSGIVIEQADTNRLAYSASITNWTTDGSPTGSVVSNVLAAPTGVVEADTMSYAVNKFRGSAVTGYVKFIYGAFVHTSALADGAYLRINRSNNLLNVTFYFTDNTVTISKGSSWATDTEAGCTSMSDDWHYCWIRTSCAGATPNFHIVTSTPNAAGDVLGWWGMHNQARFGSPIPTTTASVTRTADLLFVSSTVIPYHIDRTIYFRVKPEYFESGDIFRNGAITITRVSSNNNWICTLNETAEQLVIAGSALDYVQFNQIAVTLNPNGTVTFAVQGVLPSSSETTINPITGLLWTDAQFGVTHNVVFNYLKYISKAVTLTEAGAMA